MVSPLATILIADDNAEWRARVRELLRQRPEWQIIDEASDGVEALERTRDLCPELVLLDIGMPRMNGLQAAVEIRQAVPTTRILFLTQDNDPDLKTAALNVGAEGYVLKTKAASELFSAISTAIRNGNELS